MDSFVGTHAAIPLTSKIAVVAHHLDNGWKVVTDQPKMKLIPVTVNLAHLCAVPVDMIERQEFLIGFSATGTNIAAVGRKTSIPESLAGFSRPRVESLSVLLKMTPVDFLGLFGILFAPFCGARILLNLVGLIVTSANLFSLFGIGLDTSLPGGIMTSLTLIVRLTALANIKFADRLLVSAGLAGFLVHVWLPIALSFVC